MLQTPDDGCMELACQLARSQDRWCSSSRQEVTAYGADRPRCAVVRRIVNERAVRSALCMIIERLTADEVPTACDGVGVFEQHRAARVRRTGRHLTHCNRDDGSDPMVSFLRTARCDDRRDSLVA